MSKYTLPQLPYSLEALEPVFSRETMDYHYNKHFKAYVDKLNELIAGTEYENMELTEIIRNSEGPLFNNAGQVYNHTMWFMQMSPSPKSKPEGELAQAIERDFGSFEKFKEEFEKAATGRFGSGWAWLAAGDDGKLSVISTSNADSPLTKNLVPILTNDVWEHAYYIDYRNRRPDFVKAAWDRYDWNVVEKRYSER